jgi:molybdenum cofactor cytidylyltransferase
MNFSALILAAGNSHRMGVNKLFLKHRNGITFIEHLVNEYQKFGCNQIVVVVNPNNDAEIRSNYSQLLNHVEIAINPNPELGRFRSVKIGLNALKKSSYVFIHNIDNPCCEALIINVLQDNIIGFDYVVPTFKGKGGHPILFSPSVYKGIELEKDDRILSEYLSRFNGKRVEVNRENILMNINTPDEYDRFLSEYELKH